MSLLEKADSGPCNFLFSDVSVQPLWALSCRLTGNMDNVCSLLIGARMCLVKLEISHLNVRFRTTGLQTPFTASGADSVKPWLQAVSGHCVEAMD